MWVARDARAPWRMSSVLATLGLAAAMLVLAAGPASAAKPSLSFAAPPPARLQETSPVATSIDTISLLGTASGDVTANVQEIGAAGVASGCDSSEFASFTSGNIALVHRGGCTFATKVLNAQDAGASAVIIQNLPAGSGLFVGSVGGFLPINIPVIATSYADGSTLGGSTARIQVGASLGYTGSIGIFWDVNRAPKAIASTSCTLDAVAVSCGTGVAVGKSSTLFDLMLTSFGSGSHTFAATVTMTDGNTASGSFTFTGA